MLARTEILKGPAHRGALSWSPRLLPAAQRQSRCIWAWAQVARVTVSAAAWDLAAEALGCQGGHRAGGNGQRAAKGKLHLRVREAGETVVTGSYNPPVGLWTTEMEGDLEG